MVEPRQKEVARAVTVAQSRPAPAGEDLGERLRGRARVLAESTPPKLRLRYAQAFCTAAAGKFWEGLSPRSSRPLRPSPAAVTPLGREGTLLATEMGELAAALDVDGAAYLLGRTYATMLPEEMRASNGVFYTPPAVVERLLDIATAAGVDWRTCRAVDPACGGGAFLAPIARRMIAALEGTDPRFIVRHLASHLAGRELDGFAAWLSLVFLDATLNARGLAGELLELVTVGNSLQWHDAGDFDLVVGNPPYGRVRLDGDLREAYKRSLYGHANLYGLFLDLAVRKARKGGIIAYVTPTSFLCGEYYKNLRALLAAEAPPVSFEFLSERSGIFDDVLQETLLTAFVRGGKARGATLRFAEVSGTTALRVTDAGDVALPKPVDQPWIMPRTPATLRLAERMRAISSRLADWGYGVSTGPLVWNRYKERLRDKASKGTVPLIWAESVSADGVFSFRAERRNHSPHFAVREGDGALLVSRPCVLLQRTTAKEQSRRLIAAELPEAFIRENGGAVTIENHLNMVVPIVESPSVDTATLATFLNSTAADRAFRCISGTVAVSAYELESMPVPAAWAMQGLSKILSSPHSQKDVDEYCGRLYNDR